MARNQKNCFQLLTGNLMPKVGFGTWKIPSNKAENVVYSALKSKYPLIDCASIYRNEKEIGKAFQRALKENIVKRENLFVTSKLWNTDHKPEDVKPALKRTLKDLRLDYLDLYLIHFPVSWENRRKNEDDYPEDMNNDFRGVQTNTTIHETWKAMEELVNDGLVKDIGVSNFASSLIWELSKTAKKPISVNQIEAHPFLAQRQLIDLCHSKGIQVTAYSSFGSPSYENWAIYGKLPNLLEREEIKQIAQKHKKTVGQILLGWAVNTRNLAVIPKTENEKRLHENLNVLDVILDEEDLQILDDFDRNLRFNDQGLLWGIPIH